jgi:hypothetical protein
MNNSTEQALPLVSEFKIRGRRCLYGTES